ncbi:MAG: FHA domain-containing protein, partial [Planctomycetota bacterium]
MAFFRRKSQETPNEDSGAADGSARIVIVSLGGREDLLPDYAFELGPEPRVIGREEECDIQIVDGQISRQHLRI